MTPGESSHARCCGGVRCTARAGEGGDTNLVAPDPPCGGSVLAAIAGGLCLLRFRVELTLGLCVGWILICCLFFALSWPSSPERKLVSGTSVGVTVS